MSFNPASTPSLKCSSASASFPGGLPFSLTTNLTVTFAFTVLVVAILSSSGTVLWWFLHDLRNPTARSLEDEQSEDQSRKASGPGTRLRRKAQAARTKLGCGLIAPAAGPA